MRPFNPCSSSSSSSCSSSSSSSSSSSGVYPPPMASIAPKEQLNEFVNSMFMEGLLDEQFKQLQMLQDSSNPVFVAEVLTLFCEDSERILGEITKLLDQTPVDFGKLNSYVHQMKGSSSSVGAPTVKFACVQFRHFCEENSREGCLKALQFIKHEYYHLRCKLEFMLQLEQRVQDYDAKQQK